MSRRPIERVPIAEQCAGCYRRRLAGELLCRTHLHLKQEQADVAREQRHPLVHQDVGRGELGLDRGGTPPVNVDPRGPTLARPPLLTHSMNREEYRQAREAASFESSVLVPVLDKTCSHRGSDWCDWCASWQAGAEAADFDDGGPT